MSSIRRNLSYQTIYQILITILPLITSPYLSRVLGAYQLGICSYTTSVVGYFALFAMLGTTNYGTRSIAAAGKDEKKRSKVFWSIFFLQIGITTICIISYSVYVGYFCHANKLIAMIQGISVLACLIDINWLFFGLEKFRITVIRSSIIRVLSVVCIIMFVKSDNDTWIYILILGLSTFLSNLVLWVYVPKYVCLVKVSTKSILDNLRPNIALFLPLLAMSVYHIMDKTMLGVLSDYTQSGYYYNADKIVNITVGIISGFSTVMLPRMTALISEGRIEASNDLFKLSLECTVLVGIAISFGTAAIANEFEPVFFGEGFDECILLTIVLAPVLIIKAFSFTARYQYLVPHHKEKTYTLSVCIGALVNLIINMILIPRFGAMGAVIGTLTAEFAACVVQYYSMRSMISLNTVLKKIMVYFVFGIVMFLGVRGVSFFQIPIVTKILLEIIVGVIVMVLLCELYWKRTNNHIDKILKGFITHKR